MLLYRPVHISTWPPSGTASLDRIDSTLPYEPGNVVWVHTDINYMKHCLTEERFYELVELVHEKRKRED